MATERRNTYLDASISDESDQDAGYDSEAAEISKAGRSSKRRKIEQTSSDEDADDLAKEPVPEPKLISVRVEAETQSQDKDEDDAVEDQDEDQEDNEDGLSELRHSSSKSTTQRRSNSPTARSTTKKKKPKSEKELTPGVIYLSSLPPYLKPSALRNILEQRNFSPIKRIFLSPASKSNKLHANSGKNSRQLYTEGWIEFASKKTAKRCVETLNASTVGGKKGGYYRDDVWNMKYLKGMRWEELMAGVRGERAEMEGRRDEERRDITREAMSFVEGVEEARRREGMKRKRERKKTSEVEQGETELDLRRTWRQNEVKGKKKDQDTGNAKLSDDVRQVLGKIF